MFLFIIGNVSLFSQINSDFTQFMSNPIHLNPAFTGTNNLLSLEVFTKQQWIDVKDAPATYLINFETPINNSKTSLGATILSDWTGPLNNNRLLVSYSTIFKINHNLLFSLGLNAGADNYNINYNKINIIDQDDPAFSNGIESLFRPNFGTGAYLYSNSFYVGTSILNMFNNTKSKWINNDYKTETIAFNTNIGFKNYISGIKLHTSAMAEFQKFRNIYSLGIDMSFYGLFSIGTIYTINNSASAIAGIPINEYLTISYSYSFPISSQSLKNFNSQELSIKFNTDHLYRTNRDREFTRKAKKEEVTFKSIRYF